MHFSLKQKAIVLDFSFLCSGLENNKQLKCSISVGRNETPLSADWSAKH